MAPQRGQKGLLDARFEESDKEAFGLVLSLQAAIPVQIQTVDGSHASFQDAGEFKGGNTPFLFPKHSRGGFCRAFHHVTGTKKGQREALVGRIHLSGDESSMAADRILTRCTGVHQSLHDLHESERRAEGVRE